MNCLFCVVPCIVCVYMCVLYYCHRVATQLQLNISYYIRLRIEIRSGILVNETEPPGSVKRMEFLTS